MASKVDSGKRGQKRKRGRPRIYGQRDPARRLTEKEKKNFRREWKSRPSLYASETRFRDSEETRDKGYKDMAATLDLSEIRVRTRCKRLRDWYRRLLSSLYKSYSDGQRRIRDFPLEDNEWEVLQQYDFLRSEISLYKVTRPPSLTEQVFRDMVFSHINPPRSLNNPNKRFKGQSLSNSSSGTMDYSFDMGNDGNGQIRSKNNDGADNVGSANNSDKSDLSQSERNKSVKDTVPVDKSDLSQSELNKSVKDTVQEDQNENSIENQQTPDRKRIQADNGSPSRNSVNSMNQRLVDYSSSDDDWNKVNDDDLEDLYGDDDVLYDSSKQSFEWIFEKVTTWNRSELGYGRETIFELNARGRNFMQSISEQEYGTQFRFLDHCEWPVRALYHDEFYNYQTDLEPFTGFQYNAVKDTDFTTYVHDEEPVNKDDARSEVSDKVNTTKTVPSTNTPKYEKHNDSSSESSVQDVTSDDDGSLYGDSDESDQTESVECDDSSLKTNQAPGKGVNALKVVDKSATDKNGSGHSTIEIDSDSESGKSGKTDSDETTRRRRAKNDYIHPFLPRFLPVSRPVWESWTERKRNVGREFGMPNKINNSLHVNKYHQNVLELPDLSESRMIARGKVFMEKKSGYEYGPNFKFTDHFKLPFLGMWNKHLLNHPVELYPFKLDDDKKSERAQTEVNVGFDESTVVPTAYKPETEQKSRADVSFEQKDKDVNVPTPVHETDSVVSLEPETKAESSLDTSSGRLIIDESRVSSDNKISDGDEQTDNGDDECLQHRDMIEIYKSCEEHAHLEPICDGENCDIDKLVKTDDRSQRYPFSIMQLEWAVKLIPGYMYHLVGLPRVCSALDYLDLVVPTRYRDLEGNQVFLDTHREYHMKFDFEA